MMMRATKALTYNTRRLLPGDEFEVTKPRDVRVLKAIRKAVEVREPVDLAPPTAEQAAVIAAAVAPTQPADTAMQGPPTPQDPLDHDGDGHKGGSTAPAGGDDLKAARAEYEAVLGKRPFPGWDLATLQEKIAAHKAE